MSRFHDFEEALKPYEVVPGPSHDSVVVTDVATPGKATLVSLIQFGNGQVRVSFGRELPEDQQEAARIRVTLAIPLLLEAMGGPKPN